LNGLLTFIGILVIDGDLGVNLAKMFFFLKKWQTNLKKTFFQNKKLLFGKKSPRWEDLSQGTKNTIQRTNVDTKNSIFNWTLALEVHTYKGTWANQKEYKSVHIFNIHLELEDCKVTSKRVIEVSIKIKTNVGWVNLLLKYIIYLCIICILPLVVFKNEYTHFSKHFIF